MFIFDYKFLRLIYSRMTKNNFFSAKFRNFNKIHKPFFIIVIIDLIIIQSLFLISAVFILTNYNKNYCLIWYLILYGIFVCFLLIFCEICDLIFNRNLNSDFYNQKIQKPDIIPNNVNEVQLGLSQFVENNNNNNSIDTNENNNNSIEITNRKLKS